tara:strand:+ start:881 stop:2143 length:1263 start_codon:yes stop_codon:yes gene_type:complete
MNKYILIFFLVLWSCEDDNNIGSANLSGLNNNDCGIESTFIRELDNIDSLGNASSNDLKMIDDCSYIAVGDRSSRPWITKFNELGEEIWSKTFDEISIPQGNYGAGLIYATAVDKTNDGGYVISCATTMNHPSYNATGRIIKVDSLGETEWIRKFPTSRPYHGRDVIQTMEGDYIVVGSWYTTSAVTNEKSAFMARYDVDGNLIWIQRYGGECDEDEFQAVIQKPDGGFLAVGKFEHESSDYNCDFYGYTDLWFVSTDSEGQVLQESKIGESYWESAWDIVDIGDGTYGVVGKRRHQKRKPSNAWYLRMDGSGAVISQWHEPDYINSSGRNDGLYNLILLPDGETAVALGYKDDGNGDSQYLWAFNARTSEEIWNANYTEPGRGYSLGMSKAHDGGIIFFGKKDNGRLKIFKTDESGLIF